jgi:hypothetical protein
MPYVPQRNEFRRRLLQESILSSSRLRSCRSVAVSETLINLASDQESNGTPSVSIIASRRLVKLAKAESNRDSKTVYGP